MGFFGKGNRKNTETDDDRQRRAEAAQAAEQQYSPIVRDCLTRLQVWAFPYCQIDGWEIWHANAEGQRIVDVRVQRPSIWRWGEAAKDYVPQTGYALLVYRRKA